MWVVSMLIVWGGAALFLWWNAIQTEAQVRQMARAVASTLAVTIGNDWENTTHMETTVHLASRQDGVAYVKVRLPSGGLRTSAGDPGIDPSQVWVESEPITHFNQQLGSVEVAVFRWVGTELLEPWVRTTLWITVAATLVATLVSWRVTERATKPLERLRTAVVHWEEPVSLDPAEFSGARELEDLFAGFNEMRQRALARRAELEQEVAARTEELDEAYRALETSFQETVAALAATLDARDRMTASHGNRTAELAGRMAETLGMSAEEQRRLVLAATLHDIGKIGVPEAVLLKPGPLTEAEWRQMQAHAAIGGEILGAVSGMADVAEAVRHHHERWDGSGYPDGLAGEQIPYMSRIIAVADAAEAMCSRRRYRASLGAETVLAELRRCSGTQLDPRIVEQAWDVIEATVRSWCSEEAERSREAASEPVLTTAGRERTSHAD